MTATRRPQLPITFVVGLRGAGPRSDEAPLALPPVDVVEHAGGWCVVLEAPGADPSRLEVEVKGRTLTLRGERMPTDCELGRFLRVERGVGPFERTIELPDEPDPERAEATYADGLLRIELTRRPAPSGREIRIGRGSSGGRGSA
jgi:HSP20 family protein